MAHEIINLDVTFGGVTRNIDFRIMHEYADDEKFGNRATAFPVTPCWVAVRYRTGNKLHMASVRADRKNEKWTVSVSRHTTYGNLRSMPRPICWWDEVNAMASGCRR